MPTIPTPQEEKHFTELVKRKTEEKMQEVEVVKVEVNVSEPSSEEEEEEEKEDQRTMKKSNSQHSDFSLCSDIGAIAGIPHLNEFNPPGLQGLNEKTAMFYKAAVFVEKGVLFEDYKI